MKLAVLYNIDILVLILHESLHCWYLYLKTCSIVWKAKITIDKHLKMVWPGLSTGKFAIVISSDGGPDVSPSVIKLDSGLRGWTPAYLRFFFNSSSYAIYSSQRIKPQSKYANKQIYKNAYESVWVPWAVLKTGTMRREKRIRSYVWVLRRRLGEKT